MRGNPAACIAVIARLYGPGAITGLIAIKGREPTMRTILLLLPIVLLNGPADAQMPSLTPDQEKTLSREIGDRVVTDKVDCIRMSPRLHLTVISDDVLVYRVGSKRFVTRTMGSCNGLAKGDKPIISSSNQRVCKGDAIVVEDLVSGIRTGSCAIGNFATYEKAGKDD